MLKQGNSIERVVQTVKNEKDGTTNITTTTVTEFEDGNVSAKSEVGLADTPPKSPTSRSVGHKQTKIIRKVVKKHGQEPNETTETQNQTSVPNEAGS